MSENQNAKKQTVFTEENQAKGGTKVEKSTMNMDPKLAAALSYVVWFITGIIFFVMEKENKHVRFHAMQSIFATVALIVINTVLSFIPILGWLAMLLMAPLTFILWIFLMYKAYQGESFKLPIIGDLAMQQVEK